MNEAPLIIGVDHGSTRSDMTAICIAQQMHDASIKILAIEQAASDITKEAFDRVVDYLIRKTFRPKGYSQSHWRKVWKQSPMRRPIRFVSDGLSLNGG